MSIRGMVHSEPEYPPRVHPEALYDGKAKARAGDEAGFFILDPVKAFEDILDILGFNAESVIADIYPDFVRMDYCPAKG